MRRKGKKKKSKSSRSARSPSSARSSGEPVALRQAKLLWSRGQFDESLKQFGKAVKEHRWHPQVLVDAARAYGARFVTDKSDALLKRALTVGGENPDVQFVVGETYRMLGRFDKAENCFRRAASLTEHAPRAELELANLCERTHRLDEGLKLIAKVLKSWPDSASAAILKARLLRRTDAGEQAESVLRDMLRTTNAKATLQAEGWGELAQLLDAAGRFDEAWSSIDQCKKILIPQSASELRAAEHVGQRFARFVEDLRGEHFERWSQPKSGSPKRFGLLTGFPRSGTTLIEQVLDAHPQLQSSEERDIFSAEIFPNLSANDAHAPIEQLLDGLSAEEIEDARNRYYDFTDAGFPEPIGDRFLIDKNPAMAPMIPVVLRLFPEMRLIFALRDPRDVVVSCYLRYLPLNPVSVCFLTIQRTAEKYAADMQAWLKYRPLLKTAWTEIRYEEVVEDWQGEARRVLDFLQLPWDANVLEYRRRALDKTVRSPTYDAVTHPVYRNAVGRWKNYARQLEPVLGSLQPLVDEFGYE